MSEDMMAKGLVTSLALLDNIGGHGGKPGVDDEFRDSRGGAFDGRAFQLFGRRGV